MYEGYLLEVCGYSIFATRPVPVAQVRYPYGRTRTDPYSKLLADPTRTRGYTRTRHCQAFLCIVYVPTRLTGLQLGMYKCCYSLRNRLVMIMITKYVYTTLLRRSGYYKGEKVQEDGREEEEHSVSKL